MFLKLKFCLIALGTFAAAIIAFCFKAHEQKELKDYAKTRKLMDDLEHDSDPAILRDWLRERGE